MNFQISGPLNNWRSPSRTAHIAGLMLLAIAAQGCAVIPVPQLPNDHVTNISNEDIELIRPGETRREEISRQFGTPILSSADGSRWIYVSKSHRAGKVRVCGGMVNPIDVFEALDNGGYVNEIGAAGGCTKKTDNRVVTYLDISFDYSGIVRDSQLATVKDGKCADSNICRSEFGTVYFAGSKDEASADMLLTDS
jgi:outer membrane protein assembly factor BamE (lipoprotein component of BamABCDE complex)